MICDKCKNYFNLHISWIEGHNACNEEYCYLCTEKYDRCSGFEEGIRSTNLINKSFNFLKRKKVRKLL